VGSKILRAQMKIFVLAIVLVGAARLFAGDGKETDSSSGSSVIDAIAEAAVSNPDYGKDFGADR